MRTGFAILLLVRFPTLASLPAPGAELRFPNGLAKWIDMSWALDPVSYSIITVLLTVGAALYITGFAFPLSATVLLFCYLIVGTLQNSLGSISHYYQVMTLMLLGQSLAAWLWAATARNRLEPWTRSPAALHSFTTRVTLQILAGNYVLCAHCEQRSLDLEQPVYARAIRENSGPAVLYNPGAGGYGPRGRSERTLHPISVAVHVGLRAGIDCRTAYLSHAIRPRVAAGRWIDSHRDAHASRHHDGPGLSPTPVDLLSLRRQSSLLDCGGNPISTLWSAPIPGLRTAPAKRRS